MNESDASLKYLVKAFRYTALSNMDLEDARFLIWSKTIWDTQIYVLKTLNWTFFFDDEITQVAWILSYTDLSGSK